MSNQFSESPCLSRMPAKRKRFLMNSEDDSTSNLVRLQSRKKTRYSELTKKMSYSPVNGFHTINTRSRTRSCLQQQKNAHTTHNKLNHIHFDNSSTPNIRSRLRSFNGPSVQIKCKALPISTKILELNGSTNSSDQENNHICELTNNVPNKLSIVMTPILSSRQFRSLNKNQAVALKRLNARKIEFDIDEAFDTSNMNVSLVHEESLLSQSLVGDPKEKLLELCEQTEIRDFASFFDPEILRDIVKIGEGVYGEVFQMHKSSVLKIFPIDGNIPVNGEKQMDSHRVYPEVFISKQLTELGFKYRQNRSVNFIQLRRATIVSGRWPVELILAWQKYKEDHGSDNECLDFLPLSQEWMILEFDFAGKPLASIKFNSYREARSVIEQIAISLAAAESALQFEHRDLHWLNVLLKPTRQTKLRYRVDGVSYSVQTEGIHACIIDFTVSRLCHEGNIVYVDMSNSPEIFECEGDYQFEIYRMMQKMNSNNWRPFRPITNLYWLHYLMEKLLKETSYPRRDPDCHAVQSELAALHDSVLSGEYKSATQLVNSSFYFDTCRID